MTATSSWATSSVPMPGTRSFSTADRNALSDVRTGLTLGLSRGFFGGRRRCIGPSGRPVYRQPRGPPNADDRRWWWERNPIVTLFRIVRPEYSVTNLPQMMGRLVYRLTRLVYPPAALSNQESRLVRIYLAPRIRVKRPTCADCHAAGLRIPVGPDSDVAGVALGGVVFTPNGRLLPWLARLRWILSGDALRRGPRRCERLWGDLAKLVGYQFLHHSPWCGGVPMGESKWRTACH
jgi:hypothetical protein